MNIKKMITFCGLMIIFTFAHAGYHEVLSEIENQGEVKFLFPEELYEKLAHNFFSEILSDSVSQCCLEEWKTEFIAATRAHSKKWMEKATDLLHLIRSDAHISEQRIDKEFFDGLRHLFKKKSFDFSEPYKYAYLHMQQLFGKYIEECAQIGVSALHCKCYSNNLFVEKLKRLGFNFSGLVEVTEDELGQRLKMVENGKLGAAIISLIQVKNFSATLYTMLQDKDLILSFLPKQKLGFTEGY